MKNKDYIYADLKVSGSDTVEILNAIESITSRNKATLMSIACQTRAAPMTGVQLFDYTGKLRLHAESPTLHNELQEVVDGLNAEIAFEYVAA